MHHDCTGRLLVVGMQVVGNWRGDSTALYIYEVASFTPQKVRLRRVYQNPQTNLFEISEYPTLKSPKDVAIIEPVF